MKKSIICGIASFAMAATPMFSVFAETPTLDGGTGSSQKDVTVGEVDETVYSVDITWGDMAFDWKYDADTNEFNFQPHQKCMTIANNDSTVRTLNNLQVQGKLFDDLTSCETLATSPLDEEMYAYLTPDGGIFMTDSSINGKLKAKLSFTAAEDYNWVSGKFGKWVLGTSVQDGPLENMFIEYTEEYLPESNNIAYGNLVLEKNNNYNASTASVTESDTIGHVTINIEPDLN